MTLNYIWCAFFLVGFLAALGQFIFLGHTAIFKKIIDGTFDSAKVAVMEIALPLAGFMALWLGIMNIGEKAGAVGWLARVNAPFFKRIFQGAADTTFYIIALYFGSVASRRRATQCRTDCWRNWRA